MDDAPTPFTPFSTEQAPTAPAAAKPKRKRRQRTPKASPPVGQHDPEPTPAKRARKVRQPRLATVSVDLLLVASGLDEKAAQVFAEIVQALAELRKPSRARLVEALRKLT